MIHDYENIEFRSPINVWNPQSEYSTDFNKVKCIEFTLQPGKVFFLPPYWWYSIQFTQPNTYIACLFYRTYMNNIAILPQIGMHLLQLQNIKKEGATTILLNEPKDCIISEKEKEKDTTSIEELAIDSSTNDNTILTHDNNVSNNVEINNIEINNVEINKLD
jgi:hypothetical protein